MAQGEGGAYVLILLLIGISSILIKSTYPRKWCDRACETVEEQGDAGQDDFDWRNRIRSLQG